MDESREELLSRVRLALTHLGLTEWRIPEGWNYKFKGKVVAFAGKKRALFQVSCKLPAHQAEEALQRVDVEPHPVARLASAGWVTINVYEQAQLPQVLEWVATSAKLLAGWEGAALAALEEHEA